MQVFSVRHQDGSESEVTGEIRGDYGINAGTRSTLDSGPFQLKRIDVDVYNITHIPSGGLVCQLMSKQLAYELIEELHPFGDITSLEGEAKQNLITLIRSYDYRDNF